MSAITSIILEKRKPQKDGKFPLKLRVTYKRERHYYTVKNEDDESLAFTEEEYQKVTGDRPRDKFKDLKIYLGSIEKRAVDVIKSLPIFTFEAFERKLFGAGENEKDLLSGLITTSVKLKQEGRISTGVSYLCVYNSLMKFSRKQDLSYDRVDVHFLNQYDLIQ